MTSIGAGGALSIQPLLRQSDKPMVRTSAQDFNGYVYAVFAVPQSGAEIVLLSKRARPEDVPIGAHVRLYGYKRPNSPTISYFSVLQYR